MFGRRGLLATGLAFLPGGRTARAAGTSLIPAAHPVLGDHLDRLLERLPAGTRAELAAMGGRLRHGGLLAEALPFPAAALFAGFPGGMAAEELRDWLRHPEGLRLWRQGWAEAGFHALPCGVLETPLALRAGPGTAADDLRPRAMAVRPGPLAMAWESLPAATQGEGTDAALGWDKPGWDRPGWDRLEWERSGPRAFAWPAAYGQLIELAMPAEDWRRLSGAARAQLTDACALALAEPARLEPAARPLPPALAMGLAQALGHSLALLVPEPARRAYAAARRARWIGPAMA
ncbi:hypothetical protein [Teichococcus aerofrigidensis]